jgi:hypothetical protein
MYLCADAKDAVSECTSENYTAAPTSWLVTKYSESDTDTVTVMGVLSADFRQSPNLGIVGDNELLNGSGALIPISGAVVKSAELDSGMLAYVTEFSSVPMPVEKNPVEIPTCFDDEQLVIANGKYVCSPINYNVTCAVGEIWDTMTETCMADYADKPVCASGMVAVFADGFWDCVTGGNVRGCPFGHVASMSDDGNWECIVVAARTNDPEQSKCRILQSAANAQCGPCETAIIDQETCRVNCVPNPTAVRNRACYEGSCNGMNAAFYFGFPDDEYIRNSGVDAQIILDDAHNKNRRFNCLDCGDGLIDDDNAPLWSRCL